jgi:hypothetical protein
MDLINCNVYVNNFPYEIYRTITSIKYIHTYMYINVFKHIVIMQGRQFAKIKGTDNTMTKRKRTDNAMAK